MEFDENGWGPEAFDTDAWAMRGLDLLGCEDEIGHISEINTEVGEISAELGFDYMSLLKGGGGLLSGLSGDDKSGGAAAAAEKQRLQDAKAAAERSASTMKMLLIGVAALAGAAGIAVAVRR